MTVTQLPATTTDRLMAVADIVEFQSYRYDQEVWWSERGDVELNPVEVCGKATADRTWSCNTVGCIAGWAVALSPGPTVSVDYWIHAGATALGLSLTLAGYLFSAHFKARPATVADMLRRIARLPEGERTLPNMQLVLSDRQLRLLVAFDTDVEDEPEDDDDVELYPVEDVPDDDPEPAPETAPESSDGNGADSEDHRPSLVLV